MAKTQNSNNSDDHNKDVAHGIMIDKLRILNGNINPNKDMETKKRGCLAKAKKENKGIAAARGTRRGGIIA